MKTALLFAGQATQYVGMGRILLDRYAEAREVFARADEALGESLSRLILEGPEDLLMRTENTQPAVLTVACAAHSVLAARGFKPAVVAGHSLGEYGALVSAGSLCFEDAVRLTRRRGEYMQAAVPLGVGAMAAVQRLDDDVIEAACAATPGYCAPAVFNAPKLTVISGETEAVKAASETLANQGGIITPLAVSAPFHSQMLAPAARKLEFDLDNVEFGPLSSPYISNVDAEWIESSSAADIRQRLVRQVVGAVRWRESISLMFERGIERFWHVGPGRANLTHVKRQVRRAPTGSLDNEKDLDTVITELENR